MKPDDITIRAALDGDAPALSRLVRRNADAVLAVNYTPRQLAAWKRHNTPALWRQHIATRLCFVAVRAARLCGTVALEQDELVGFYISPVRRGEGIGRRLLARLEQAAIQHGHRKLWLTSSPSALSFYLAHGWKKRRRVTLNILGVDFEETLMTRKLPLRSPLEAVHITRATSAGDIAAIRALFQEYAAWLRVDLCFQGFAEELATLPGRYAAPRGSLLLATIDEKTAGCVALRPVDKRTCEMKRLFVRENSRGRGLGRALAQRVIAEARSAGYTTMVLDTLPFMQSAVRLYEALGFKRRAAYHDSQFPETVFMELQLGEV